MTMLSRYIIRELFRSLVSRKDHFMMMLSMYSLGILSAIGLDYPVNRALAFELEILLQVRPEL
jgi:hypothetical protein